MSDPWKQAAVREWADNPGYYRHNPMACIYFAAKIKAAVDPACQALWEELRSREYYPRRASVTVHEARIKRFCKTWGIDLLSPEQRQPGDFGLLSLIPRGTISHLGVIGASNQEVIHLNMRTRQLDFMAVDSRLVLVAR